ncbi:MAG: beta-lactamase family protein [Lachnospiraceae bacterium]|nr:beta-lactamase family protein [Lachnospiraceae bacterium]
MDRFAAMDEFLQKNVKEGPSGCGCMVTQNGEVLYEKYFGYSNLEKKTPVTDRSVFRQFSTTKVIVCTALMMLYERGKFLLQDPIYEYFPEWKNTMVAEENLGPDGKFDGTYTIRPVKRPIQIADCLNMSMGIGYGGEDYTHRQMAAVRQELEDTLGWNYTLRDDIRAMAQVPVRFDPGEHWLYGFGHELVAGLIAECSGIPVSEFMKKYIFEPLGMENTDYRYHGDMRANLVTPYIRHEDGTMEETTGMFDRRQEPDAVYEGGGAGLLSTVHDYGIFGTMLANGGTYRGERIIGPKTIDLMRQNRLNETQLKEFQNSYLDGYGYGLGFRTLIDPSRVSNSSVGEFGWTGYMGTYIAIDPAEKACVTYMHNMVPNNEEYIHHRVRNIAFGAIDKL